VGVAKRVVGAFLATSDQLPGRRHLLSEDDIRSLAEQIEIGSDEPISVNHDSRRRIHRRIVATEVRRTGSGSLGLWVETELDEDDLALFPDGFGYSVAFAKELIELDPSSTLPVLQLVVDDENFTELEFEQTVDALRGTFNVSAGWYQQYQELPPPVVILLLGLKFVLEIPPEALKSVLVDAFKDRFLKQSTGRATIFQLRLRGGPSGDVAAYVETSDPEVFGDAMATIREAIRHSDSGAEFDPQTRDWRRIPPPGAD
jgi:hypothetical protein